MGNWQKSFRSIPKHLAATVRKFQSDNIRVLAGKRIHWEEVERGDYKHLGLTVENFVVGESWEVFPPPSVGTRSKRNAEGWEEVRKDLPKFTKYFYHDIQNFGDGSRYGWSTVAIPREIYERDEFPPFAFHIELSVKEEVGSGKFGVVFAIDEIFSRSAKNFEADLLFAINLLQECTGVSGVVEAGDPDFVFSSKLNWELFPPGDLKAVSVALNTGHRIFDKDVVHERLRLFESFEPTEYLRGLGGNDHYIGAKYADDLVAFENLKYGNALYVLYGDWETLSKQSRSELLKKRTSQFDRIIHNEGWETRFAVLMQKELQKRGTRVRIGRNSRRR